MPTENRSSTTEMVSELLPCPFCGQQDFLIERLDSDASVVICQGLTGPHEACLARGPVGVAQDEGEEQPGRDKAVELWNARAEQHRGEPLEVEDILALAEKAFGQVVDYDLMGNPITDYKVLMVGAYAPAIHRLVRLACAYADPGEMAQAKALAETAADQVVKLLAQLRDANDKLAERDALLHEVSISPDWSLSVDLQVRISNALSASAEPSAPVEIEDPCKWSDRQVLDFLGVALRNVDLQGEVRLSEIRQGFEYMRDRAALERKPIEPLPPVDGDLLPPIGSKVLIHLGREDKWAEHTVVGYYAWGNHGLDQNVYRVFVRVRDAEGYLNARLLRDVRPVDDAQPQP